MCFPIARTRRCRPTRREGTLSFLCPTATLPECLSIQSADITVTSSPEGSRTRRDVSVDHAIDAVYTWVDGSDPSHRERLGAFLAMRADIGDGSAVAGRFRDNQELRYSLRSLERFAPWIRTVHLVTDGQVPGWLRTTHPRLNLVTHSDIFLNGEHLPTFNSHAIEANLHRIEGLSESYLYFNDDVFLGSEVSPEDFLLENGAQQILLEEWLLPTSLHDGSVTDRALAFTQRLLDSRYGELARRTGIAHAPQLYRKSVVNRLVELWPEEFESTSSSRFRSPTDIALRVLYYYHLIESRTERYFPTHLIRDRWPSTYAFVRVDSDVRLTKQRLGELLSLRPKFFCLNDDAGDAGALSLVWQELNAFLQQYYPNKSSFELGEPNEPC
jgi:hypothetical protein